MRRVEHFKRAKAMFAAIAPAMLLDGAARLEAIRKIGSYKSRGKGRGTPMFRHGNKPGRYEPHQGAQERLRRVLGGWAKSRVPKNQAIAQARAIGAEGMKRRAA